GAWRCAHAEQAQRFDLSTDGIDPRLRLWQVGGFHDLTEGKRLHAEVLVGERLESLRPGQKSIFGAKHIDRILLAFNGLGRCDNLLGPTYRLLFYRIDIDRRYAQGA